MKDIELITNDEHLSKVCDDLPLIEENLQTFLRVYRARKLCKGCGSLSECRQKTKGQRPDLRVDGVLIEEIEYCDYAAKVRNRESILQKYLYCDVPKDLAGIDLGNVTYTPQQKQLYLLLAAILYEKREKVP
jgi:hypothetical protein